MAKNTASSPAALRSQGSAQAQDKSSTRRDQGKDSAKRRKNMKWDMGVSINGGVSLNGWFISWKIRFKMDDLEVPSFQETSI